MFLLILNFFYDKMKEKAVKRGLKMEFFRLNPFIRSVGIYETVARSEERIAYDSKIIYMISGDIAVNIEDEKKFNAFNDDDDWTGNRIQF